MNLAITPRKIPSKKFWLLCFLGLTAGCSSPSWHAASPSENLLFSGEKHLQNIRQLTYGGTNAEAYWSYDGKWLSFQAKGGGVPGLPQSKPLCDQIYRIRANGTDAQLVSTDRGRTTCAFYLPGDQRILYSSTHEKDAQCPPEPDRSQGYVWPIYNSYQIYTVDPRVPESVVPLEPGAPRAYSAEAVTCKDGSVVFTSDRDGDLELYTGKINKFGILEQTKRITTSPGYDGGAFFSQDCKKLVWRASRPKSEKELQDYQDLLKKHLVRPGKLEIWMANADGTEAKQVTRLNAASFAPYFTPSADRILFSSNFEDPQGRGFAIYSIRTNGTGLERITHSGVFDGFPMFSPDGKQLAFSSNRNSSAPRETNIFIADWVENPTPESHELSRNESDPVDRYLSNVKLLSDPKFAGRGVGTPEMAEAEKLTASLFEKSGIRPFFETFAPASLARTGGKDDALRTTQYHHPVSIKPLEVPHEGRPSLTGVSSSLWRPLLTGNNILGTLGDGCQSRAPAVVLGAHLDHLGLAHPSSLEATKKGIHHGADDNASGVISLVEASRFLKQDLEKQPKALSKTCFVFAAFTGEESGVAGSARVVELLQSLKIPVKAMINMDMVGRLTQNKLIIFGTDSAKEWKNWVTEECLKLGLQCPGGGDGYGPSDHMPFYAKGIPVLHLFTGPHANYHRVSDTWEKINATGGIQVAEAAARLALRSALAPRFLTYQKPSGSPLLLSGRGNGAFLGTIPDYAQMTSPHGPEGDTSKSGVLLSGARANSPAEKAGVQAGDILFEIALQSGEKKPTPSLRDFMEVLKTLKPGDRIVLGIRRAEESLRLSATVGSKSSQ